MQKLEKIYGIGTYWWFEFFDKNINLKEIEYAIKSIISDFEEKYSRFKETSIVSKLNKEREVNCGDYPDKLEELREMLELSLDLYGKTEGIFNIGLGKILEDTGYDSSLSLTSKNIANFTPDLEKLLYINKEKIYLSGEGNIDLGGVGKGFLIDKLAKILQEKFKLKYFLINGGGDIFVTSDNDVSIELILEHPKTNNTNIGKIKIKNQALCSSSPFKRMWKDKTTNKYFSHIVNPEDQKSVQDFAAFTVFSSSSYCDALATCYSIAGDDKSLVKKLYSKTKVEFMIIDSKSAWKSKNFPNFEQV